MYLVTQIGAIVTVIETLILCKSNLRKILPNYILNFTRAYNLFWVKPLRSHCGHLLKVSVPCTNKHSVDAYLPLLCPWFSLQCVPNVFVCIATHFLAIFIVCELAFCFYS